MSLALLPGAPFHPPRPRIALVTDAIGASAPTMERDLLRLRSVPEVAAFVNRNLPPGEAHEDAGIFTACMSHWFWLRGGRRVVTLEPGAVSRLLAAPCPVRVPDVERGFAVQWEPRPEFLITMDGEPMYVAGGYLMPASEASAKAGHFAAFDPMMLGEDGEWRGTTPIGVDVAGDADERTRPWQRLLIRALAALADRRVSHVVARRPTSTQHRRAAKRGVVVQTLELTPDAEGVWVTRKIGDAPAPVVVPERDAPAAHVVHEHTARWWVRDEHADAGAIERDADGFALTRHGKHGRLVAVRLPVREHVRGSGDGRAKVVRLVPGRAS